MKVQISLSRYGHKKLSEAEYNKLSPRQKQEYAVDFPNSKFVLAEKAALKKQLKKPSESKRKAALQYIAILDKARKELATLKDIKSPSAGERETIMDLQDKIKLYEKKLAKYSDRIDSKHVHK